MALAGGGLLAWNKSGQAEVMRPGGLWGPVFRLAAVGEREASLNVVDAAGLDGRALLLVEYAGERSRHETTVFELDGTGKVRQFPNLPATNIFVALSVWDGRVWIEDLDGEIHELLSDGQLGRRFSPPDNPRGLDFPRGLDLSWLVGGSPGSPVFYVSPDRSEANAHAGYCYSTGRNGWRVDDGCAVAPTICGDHLLTVSNDGMTVVVRALADGRPLATWKSDRDPLVVCDGDHEVVIGRRTLAKLSLPDLTLRWTVRLKSGRARAMATLADKVLVWTNKDAVEWLPAGRSRE